MSDGRMLHADIMRACFIRESSPHANNRLDLERLTKPKNDEVRQRVVQLLTQRVVLYEPDFVTAVPDHANWIAHEVADAIGCNNIVLQRDAVTNSVSVKGAEDREVLLRSERGVLLNDVFNTFIETKQVLQDFALRGRIVGAVAIWDRGIGIERRELAIDHGALFPIPIPATLPSDSRIWHYTYE